jgi:predicted nucleic acid-binding protein
LSSFVLDCSITMAWFFKDEADVLSNAILEQLTKDTAWVPTIWKLEVANAFLMAENKKRISSAEIAQAMIEIKLLPIEVDKEEPDSEVLLNLARRYNLSVYDATYLDLAIRRDLALASKDNKLISAAKKCGVQLSARK